MKIALIGYGKMGKAIEKEALNRNHTIGAKIDKDNEKDIDKLTDVADVAIEFSTPSTAFDNIQMCLQIGVPVISGTTGWLDNIHKIKNICKQNNGTFLYASNFSIGVNLFFRINKYVAQLMSKFPQYQISMEEIHHIHKLDSPSGTAITLAEDITHEHSAVQSWKEVEKKANTSQGVLPIVSKREGEVPGTHSISYSSPIDSIVLQHEAHSRQGFALGAVLVAEWIKDKKGIYTMDDFMDC